jgi:adenylosuccinate lyase
MLKDGSPKINLYVCYTIFVTDFTIFQSPFSSRYGSSEMRKVWSEQHRWDLASKVWTEVARAQHKAGLVSKEELEDLEAHIGKINVERVQELEKETGHDIVAGIRAYQEVAKIGGRIIHHGMTSEDMTTNMDGMRYQEALKLILNALDKLLHTFAKRIDELADMPCMGWTHMQPAEPITVGYRLAVHAYNLLEDRKRLVWTVENIRVKGVKGAVGSGASFEEILKETKLNSQEFEKEVMKELGLKSSLISTQISPRKYDVWVADALMGISDSLYQFGLNARILQSPPFGEWSEPRGEKQVGSSAMPWKKNPVGAENIMSLSRGVLGDQVNVHNVAMNQVLERGIDDSGDRRITNPDMFFRVDEALARTNKLVDGLVIHKVAVDRHLNTYGPFAAIEKVLAAAVRAGADRQATHEALRKIALEASAAVEKGETNPLVVLATQSTHLQKTSQLSAETIQDIFADDIRHHTGTAAERSRVLVGEIKATCR